MTPNPTPPAPPSPSPPPSTPGSAPDARSARRLGWLVVGVLVLLVSIAAVAVWGVPSDGTPKRAPEVGRERDLPTAPELTGPAGGPGKAVPDVPDSVTVFYATDRAPFAPDLRWYLLRFAWPAGAFLVGWGVLRLLLKVIAPRYRAVVTVLRVLHLGLVLVLVGHAAWTTFRMVQTDRRLDLQYGDARYRPSDDAAAPYALGVAQVSIPPNHTQGEIERPSPWRGDFFEDPDVHMVLFAVKELPDTEWSAKVRRTVEGSPNEDAFVFVHGYNVTFEEAVLRTAQIAYDLRFGGAPICWSWPSQGGYAEYTVDEENVRWSTGHLARFLRELGDRSGAKRIHLVAHSMGNRALTEALLRIGREVGGAGAPFDQVVLAAPDLDAETFRQDIAPAILGTAQKVTLYASTKDVALQLSRRVHGNPRAGEAGEDIVVVPGIDTVDVSRVSGGHSYIGNSGRVLNDLGEVLIHRARVEQRPGIVEKAWRRFRYWLLELGG